MKNILLLLALSLSLSSCSASKSPDIERSGFKVSVTANGKEVKDLSQVLVHRVEISEKSLNKVFGKSDENPNYQNLLMPKKDFAGAIIGLEVQKQGIDKLGLESGDVVMAIGTVKIVDEQDFWHLKEAIEIDKSAELTIVREGRANKILYFLNE